MTVVPWPGSDRSHAFPPACAANLRTTGNPSPAAESPPFVVKNGSNACSAVPASMPVPVSVTRNAT